MEWDEIRGVYQLQMKGPRHITRIDVFSQSDSLSSYGLILWGLGFGIAASVFGVYTPVRNGMG